MEHVHASFLSPPSTTTGWKQLVANALLAIMLGFLLLEGDSCGQYEQDHLGDKVPKRGYGRMPPY